MNANWNRGRSLDLRSLRLLPEGAPLFIDNQAAYFFDKQSNAEGNAPENV